MRRPHFLPAVLSVTLLAFGGCGKSGEAPQPVSLSEASAGVKSAFSTAPAGLKESAEEAAQGIADGNYASAFVQLDNLASHPELTPEQRRSLAESQITVMQKLSEAAAQGDESAAKALEIHRARK
ncbi:MAG TPA: hypothetical protein PLX89_16850 [Verrucomicrobiota bacterium]|nr:hypothetical protein [Verrucomicrobiales bacterium]HRI14667.1 hypothetical protein [Verrucomicrobiota bacterium]